MFFTNRPARAHHIVIKWAAGLLCTGIGINVIMTLWEGTDIGFFSANTVFTAMSAMTAAIGLVAALSKDLNLFLLFTIVAIFNFVFCIQPIVMWTDEGNLCDSLTANEQQLGRDCYTAAVGATAGSESTSFNTLLSLVSSCYMSNDILTSASGVCYNIRWAQSNGSTIRAFMLISWLCQFFGTVLSIVCSVIELAQFGKLKKMHDEIDYLVQKAALQFFRDTNIDENREDYCKLCKLFSGISDAWDNNI